MAGDGGEEGGSRKAAGLGCHEGVGGRFAMQTGVRTPHWGRRGKGAVVCKCDDMTLDDEKKIILRFHYYYFQMILRVF